MEFTSIPNLNKKISRVGLGTWAIGGWMWGGTEEKDAIATIHRALDLGINLIDTAPVYGFGHSEEVVGKALKLYGKKDQAIIATKAGLSWQNQKVYRDARRQTLIKEIEASLKRLQIESIDLYQLHWPDPLTPIAETAEVFNKLLEEGKIKAVGVSNLSVEQMEQFQQYCPLHSLQSPFNLFEREIEKNELKYCLQNKIATLGYGSLCRGLLSGKMQKNRQFKGDDLRKTDPKFQEPAFSAYLNAVQQLEGWAKEKHNKPLLALAFRWALDKGIHSALWGARLPQQMEGIETIWGWRLNEADFREIDQILKKNIPSPIGPEFMAPPTRGNIA